MSDSLWPYGLYSAWNSPGQNTGVGSLSLLQGIFPTQRSNSGLPHRRQFLLPAEPQRKPKNTGVGSLSLLQGIFLTQESTWGLLHCRRILYQLRYEEAQVVKNRLPMQETREMWVWSMGWEDLLEEVMATHFSILAWRILWTEEPSWPQSMGHKELDTTEVTWHAHMHTVIVNSSYIVSQICFKWFKCPERDRKEKEFWYSEKYETKVPWVYPFWNAVYFWKLRLTKHFHWPKLKSIKSSVQMY